MTIQCPKVQSWQPTIYGVTVKVHVANSQIKYMKVPIYEISTIALTVEYSQPGIGKYGLMFF